MGIITKTLIIIIIIITAIWTHKEQDACECLSSHACGHTPMFGLQGA